MSQQTKLVLLVVVAVAAIMYWTPTVFRDTPPSKMLVYALIAVSGWWLFQRTRRERFDTSAIAKESAERAKLELVGGAKQSKPTITIPALEEDMVTRIDAAGQETGFVRALERGKEVQAELFDRKQSAEQMLTNVREQDTTRGAITPTEDEQIFGTRPSVRDSKDGYKNMFNGVPNSGMKYIYSAV
jgi:MFS superfamily sulfate permease-like transporter